MWPTQSGASQRVEAAEQLVEGLYLRALRKWLPLARDAVLPGFDAVVITAAADEPPPDPDAVAKTRHQWEAIAAAIILPGVANLWTTAAEAAAEAVGKGIDLAAGVGQVFAAARDDFLASYRQAVSAVPGMVRDELQSLISSADPSTTTRSALRKLVRKALKPGSDLVSKIVSRMGRSGASILNNASATVAAHGDADLRLYWISRRDERVRSSHRVADGQIVPLGTNFMVGGFEMAAPGDTRAPISEWAGCRCSLIVLRPDEDGPAPWDGEIQPLAASVAAGEETQQMTSVEINVASDSQPVDAGPETFRTFTDAPVAFIGVPTSDYRMLAKDIELEFRQMPLAMTWMRQTGEGHMSAFTVAVIESMRAEDDKVLASGYMLNTAEADEAAEQLAHGVTRPSIEMGKDRWWLTTEDGEEFTEEMFWNLPILDNRGPRPYKTWTAAEILGTSLVATPAFGDTVLTLNPDREPREVALVAASGVRTFPAECFADPQLSGPKFPTMDADGRIYGHIACWDAKHRTLQHETPPRSPTNYSHFHTSAVQLEDGSTLEVGRLTVGLGHAGADLSGPAAAAHYDNPQTCWAIVRAGQDAYGIWFSGVAAPWATSEQVEMGLSSRLSGDWRDFGLGRDLVAAQSVNTAGFVSRGRSDEYGRPVALVAALGPPMPAALRQRQFNVDIKTALAEVLTEQRESDRREAALVAAAAAQDAAFARADELTRPKTVDEQADEAFAKAAQFAELLAKAGL